MKYNVKKHLANWVLTAFFISLGLLLPWLTGQLPQINKFLLPMHIPILLCGLVCGWQYGLCAGLVTPVLRSTLFGFPVMYPTALAMAPELAMYGLFTGLLYAKAMQKSLFQLYFSLSVAMFAGRLARGLSELLLLSLGDSGFQAGTYLAATLLPSMAGAVLQLLIIPPIIAVLKRTNLLQ